MHTLSSSQIEIFAKSGYAAELLYILTLGCAKLSIIMLLRLLTPDQRHQRIALGVGAFIAAWGVFSFFAAAFQCSAPDVWSSIDNTCDGRVSGWDLPFNSRWWKAGEILAVLWYHQHRNWRGTHRPPNIYRAISADVFSQEGDHLKLLWNSTSVKDFANETELTLTYQQGHCSGRCAAKLYQSIRLFGHHPRHLAMDFTAPDCGMLHYP